MSLDIKNKQVKAIIANIQSGIIINDKNGKIIAINKWAKKFFGWCKCSGKNQSMCLPYLKTLDGQEITPQNSPFHLPLKAQKYANYLLEAHNPKGKKMIFNFNGSPLKDDKGKINGGIVMFLDVTKQYKLQEKLRRSVAYEKIKSSHLSILHEISLNLNKEKDVSKILNTVLKAAVAITESAKGVIIKKNQKGFHIAHSYSAKEAAGAPVINSKSLRHLLDNKFFTNKSLRVANYHKLCKTKASLGIKALILTPIFGGKLQPVAYIVLANKKRSRRFSLEDEKVTQILSAHAKVAIANATNYEREHRIAQVLQKSLLPSQSFAKSLNPNIDASLTYKPATNDSLVGGDFYDFFEVDQNKIACLIADVNGKGVEAAAITSLVKSTIKAFAYEKLTPDKVVEKTNKVLFNQTDPSVFITAVYGILDLKSGFFEYANAGHPPPLLYKDKHNGVVTLNQGSTPLGLLADEKYELYVIDLEPHDCLALYTDGIIEARKNKILYGENRLIKCLLANAHLSNVANKMLADVEQFAGGNITDDIALVTLKLKNKIEQPFVKTVSLWS